MQTLRMLGGIGLSDSSGREQDALLRQPKHVALLAYLSLPEPGVWHRRDTILGSFWAEHDQSRARSALRSALYTLRRHLPEGAIISRGDDELSIDATILQTDVAMMRRELAARQYEQALSRYGGELLPGLFVAASPVFDSWLQKERASAHAMARMCANALGIAREQDGDLVGAVNAARRGAQLDPDDEAATRRLIQLLDLSGDRAQAFAVYERFRNHLADAFGVRPSAETVALLEAVRTRKEPSATVVNLLAAPRNGSGSTNGGAHTADRASPHPESTELAPELPTELPPHSAPDPVTLALLPSLPANGVVSDQASMKDADALNDDGRASPHNGAATRTRNGRWYAVVAAVLVIVALTMLRPGRTGMGATPAVAARTMVFLPMVNNTGAPRLDYVAEGMIDGVATRLDGIGGLAIRHDARADWAADTHLDPQAIGRAFSATMLVRSTLTASGDSLQVQSALIDSGSMRERPLSTIRFSAATMRDAENQLASDIAAMLFRRPLPSVPRDLERRIDTASERLTFEGWHRLLENPAPLYERKNERVPAAAELFQQAIDTDPTNARAWAGLSSTYAARTMADAIEFDQGYELTTSAAGRALALDSLQGTALANMGILIALKHRHLADGLAFMKRAEAVEPSNPEVYLVKSALLRAAHLHDEATSAILIARRLDPISPYYLDREAIDYFCTDRPEIALDRFQSKLSESRNDRLALIGAARALAQLGRYDEAIDAWARDAVVARDTALARRLGQAKGADGYWRARHAEGAEQLRLLTQAKGRISPVKRMLLTFASGDSTAGFAQLERLIPEKFPALYHLSCNPNIDEVRHSARFKAAIQAIGALPN